MMPVPDYEYPLEECDVPDVRKPQLAEYRKYRQKCLEYLRADSPTSITTQIHDLAWHTAVFRTLNEARRIEPNRTVNGALWELTTEGYAALMALGIRKLVDKDSRTDSLPTAIACIKRRPELLTRENYVCFDGLPFDYETVQRNHYKEAYTRGENGAHWLDNRGPNAWATSKLLHEAFDKLGANPPSRSRTDKLNIEILEFLKSALDAPAISKVCELADRRIAHAERLAEDPKPVPTATYNDIDEALRQLVRITDYLSSTFFFETAIGNVVPTPQFDVLEGLDAPWVTTRNVEMLNDHWSAISDAMDDWVTEPFDFK